MYPEYVSIVEIPMPISCTAVRLFVYARTRARQKNCPRCRFDLSPGHKRQCTKCLKSRCKVDMLSCIKCHKMVCKECFRAEECCPCPKPKCTKLDLCTECYGKICRCTRVTCAKSFCPGQLSCTPMEKCTSCALLFCTPCIQSRVPDKENQISRAYCSKCVISSIVMQIQPEKEKEKEMERGQEEDEKKRKT